jgi:hypothetical protein
MCSIPQFPQPKQNHEFQTRAEPDGRAEATNRSDRHVLCQGVTAGKQEATAGKM